LGKGACSLGIWRKSKSEALRANAYRSKSHERELPSPFGEGSGERLNSCGRGLEIWNYGKTKKHIISYLSLGRKTSNF